MQKLFLSTALAALLLSGNVLATTLDDLKDDGSEASNSTSSSTIEDDELDAKIEALRTQAEKIILERQALEEQRSKKKEEAKRKQQEIEELERRVALEKEAVKNLQAEQEAEAKSQVGKTDSNFGTIKEENDQAHVKFTSLPAGGRDSDWYVWDGLLGKWYTDRNDGPNGKHYRYYPGDASYADVSIFDSELDKLRENFDLKVKGVLKRYDDSSTLTDDQKGGQFFKGLVNGKFW